MTCHDHSNGVTIEADRMWSPSASTFLGKPSGVQYKRTKPKSKRHLAKYRRLAVHAQRVTCVISGRTVEKNDDSLGYRPFAPCAEQAKSYQTLCV